MAKKLPYIPLYYKDWLADTRLSSVSAAARGVWIDLLCLMWDCDERGVLIVGERPWTEQQLSAMLRGDTDTNLRCIRELLDAGVARRDKRGAIFNARMVADEALRNKKAAAGAKGGKASKGASRKGSKPPSKSVSKSEAPSANANASANASETAFERFYNQYPRKKDRKAAKRAWDKLGANERERALDAVGPFADATKQWPPGDRQFIKHPATWLNAGAYDDDRSEWAPGTDKEPEQSPYAVDGMDSRHNKGSQ